MGCWWIRKRQFDFILKKMKKELKKHIKLLAEKFNHNVEYEKNTIVLKNNYNRLYEWRFLKLRKTLIINFL
ncbi:MAG: hypothetical protein ACJAYJ_002661 [Saprospiraceae bacterium]|jgi:hypothetical protein